VIRYKGIRVVVFNTINKPYETKVALPGKAVATLVVVAFLLFSPRAPSFFGGTCSAMEKQTGFSNQFS